jgi:putative transposase
MSKQVKHVENEQFEGIFAHISLSDIRDNFFNLTRSLLLEIMVNVMAEEVALLCGEKYHPDNSEYARAGSAKGHVFINGERENLVRPRVRNKSASGKSNEHNLTSYTAAQDPHELHQQMITALCAGVSSREQKKLHRKTTSGVSKSEVSRLWKKEGKKKIAELRERDISSQDWLGLMLDGIGLSNNLLAIVALGINTKGEKIILDFEIGSSESAEVCKSLLRRLKTRGFKPIDGHKLLVLLDGSKALSNAAKVCFDNVVIQRCLVHKERNLKSYISRKHYGELSQHFNRLRKVEGEEAAREILNELEGFVGGINQSALESLKEAGDDLITIHKLHVPATLNKSLLSTNAIENSFRNTRLKTRRVCRWRGETEQPARWLAYALLEAESGFNRIRGYRDIDKLKNALCIKVKEDSGGHLKEAS